MEQAARGRLCSCFMGSLFAPEQPPLQGAESWIKFRLVESRTPINTFAAFNADYIRGQGRQKVLTASFPPPINSTLRRKIISLKENWKIRNSIMQTRDIVPLSWQCLNEQKLTLPLCVLHHSATILSESSNGSVSNGAKLPFPRCTPIFRLSPRTQISIQHLLWIFQRKSSAGDKWLLDVRRR